MNLRKLIFTNNACYKAGKTITPIGITVHSTGANNPNLSRYVGPDDGLLGLNKYNNHWNQDTPDGQQVCVHGFIGKLADGSVAAYQTLPWNHRGWHGGSGAKGSVNNTHIGFEICEDGLNDAVYFNAVYKEAAELCAYLCKEFKFNPMADGVIIGHYEGAQRGIASNHGDPGNWFPKHGKSMDTFRADVMKLLEIGMVVAPAPVQPVAAAQIYRVRKTWADSKSQIGAYTILQNAKNEADRNKEQGYKVFDEGGNVVFDPQTTVQAAETLESRAAHILELVKANAVANRLFPSVKAAQMIIESDYMRSELAAAANNCFGMKTSLSGNTWPGSVWDGVSKYAKQTKEQNADGKEQTITAEFRRYPRVEDSIADHTAYLLGAKNGAKLRYEGIRDAKDYRRQIQLIKDGGYATDVNYVDKICDVIKRYNLDNYDAEIVPLQTPEEITVDAAIADGIITDRTYWLGVLDGTVKPTPGCIKLLMDNAHGRIKNQ